MIRRVRLVSAAALLLAVLAFAACGSSGDDGSAGATPADASLTGTTWLLDTSTQTVPDAGKVVSTLKLQGGRATGSDGCNDFSGPYEASGDALKLGPLASTRKACVDPFATVSGTVLAGFAKVARQQISGTTLRLLDGAGTTLLTYTATTPSVTGSWTAVSVSYDDAIRGVLESTKLTADFDGKGEVSGSGGCNDFSGPYQARGETLRVGPLTATEKACADQDANVQEAGYLTALAAARRFEQVADRLTLFDARGHILVVFDRAG